MKPAIAFFVLLPGLALAQAPASTNRADDQLVDSRVRLIAFQDESGQQKEEEKDWEGEKQSPDSQRKFPFK